MDLLKVSVIVLFVILTVLTVKIHPEIHQPMIIEDASFKLERISDKLVEMPVQTSINTQPKNARTEPNEKTINTNTTPKQEITKPISTQPVQTKNIKINTEQPSQSQLELLKRIVENSESIQIQEQEQKPKQINQPEQKTIKNITQKNVTPTYKNPYMSEQEEIIAWNKWRSNIQNEIMRNSEIDYAPLGTVFTFTFIVDKFGNISNIKVECSNPNFMDLARNNVKPAISKLQRKPILNFPRGTQRTSTVFTGLFLIGTQERYSTPNDFHDFERITY